MNCDLANCSLILSAYDQNNHACLSNAKNTGIEVLKPKKQYKWSYKVSPCSILGVYEVAIQIMMPPPKAKLWSSIQGDCRRLEIESAAVGRAKMGLDTHHNKCPSKAALASVYIFVFQLASIQLVFEVSGLPGAGLKYHDLRNVPCQWYSSSKRLLVSIL